MLYPQSEMLEYLPTLIGARQRR